MFTITTNSATVAAQLQGTAKQLRFATALAITRTAVKVKEAERAELVRAIDRPTPWTLNSIYLRKATPAKLEARVWLKDDLAGSGTPATKYLLPQVEGGARSTKRFERALQAAGALPNGWQVVPGSGALRDAYGNPSRGQIIQILSQLRITLVAGHTRNMSFDSAKAIRAQRRAGGRYFVVPVGRTSSISPGIYIRDFIGRNITPVYHFKSGARRYAPRLRWYQVGDATVARHLKPEWDRAVREVLKL